MVAFLGFVSVLLRNGAFSENGCNRGSNRRNFTTR
nr:MAG TPA: hypothetical protein [Caudoviricetes sp.]